MRLGCKAVPVLISVIPITTHAQAPKVLRRARGWCWLPVAASTKSQWAGGLQGACGGKAEAI